MKKKDQDVLVCCLNRAHAEQIVIARHVFVRDDQTMCPIAAIYKEATGVIPYQFNDPEMDVEAILDALRLATGIDFDRPFQGFHNLYMFFVCAADDAGFDFEQIRDLVLREPLS